VGGTRSGTPSVVVAPVRACDGTFGTDTRLLLNRGTLLASHVIFKLRLPNDQGVFSDRDSEDNYKYAMHVVDINDPTKSLMLIKPTRPTDSAGNVGDYGRLETAAVAK
jgi:hypothetical protein